MSRGRTWRCGAVCLLLVSVLGLAACKGDGGGVLKDPILRLSTEEALEKGKHLLEKGKYAQAVKYLEHAFEVSPNSAEGREALLLVADAYYLDGGESNFLRSEAKYRDFLNRFPTSDSSAYVQLQLANSLAKRVLRADRDQTATRKAIEEFELLIRIYPTSEYAIQARQEIQNMRNVLAKHEYVIGRFNRRRGLPPAAAHRLVGILMDYPDYPEMDDVLLQLGLAYRAMGEGEKEKETFDRLRNEYPDSKWLKKIPGKPKKAKKT